MRCNGNATAGGGSSVREQRKYRGMGSPEEKKLLPPLVLIVKAEGRSITLAAALVKTYLRVLFFLDVVGELRRSLPWRFELSSEPRQNHSWSKCVHND